jgi:hypothetical protein
MTMDHIDWNDDGRAFVELDASSATGAIVLRIKTGAGE